MPTWKKIIVSGSQAELAAVSSSLGLIVGSSQYITPTQAGTRLTGSFSGSFSGDGSDLQNVVTSLNFSGASGTGNVDHLTQTLRITTGSGTGINTVASGQTLTVSGIDATTTTKGVASFDSDDFSVSTGQASIKNAGVRAVNINTDVVGTGLSGGAGTALSVNYGSTSGTAVQGNTNITINGTANEVEITGTAAQALGSGPSYTIGLPNNVTVTNNLTVGGDVTVQGKVTAEEFHTEFVSASIIYQSGSTKFGDTADDVHEFTGSVFIEGQLNTEVISFPKALTSTITTVSDSFILLPQGYDITGSLTIGSNSDVILIPTGSPIATLSDLVHDDLIGFVANEHIDHSGVVLTAGDGLSGGGDITTSRTFAINTGSSHFLSGSRASISVTDTSGASGINLTYNSGTGVLSGVLQNSAVTVTAGSGLTGGGSVSLGGSTTLNIGAGTGIDVAADAISVDVSDFMTNGANNRVITATGTDAMNAEANLTFDGSTLGVTGAITTTGNVTIGGDLVVQGNATEIQTANILVEDAFVLLRSGSSSVGDSGIIFGGSEGVAQSGTALVWDGSYNTNDGRLSVANNVASNATSVTPSYYVAGVYEGTEANAATAQADHPGNIRIEGGEIFIYV